MKQYNHQKMKSMYNWKIGIGLLLVVFLFASQVAFSAETAVMKVNRTWCGVLDNAHTGAFSYSSGFFPVDYDCMGPSMEEGSSLSGSSIIMAATNWTDPNNHLIPKVAIQPVDNYSAWSVVEPMTNYIRWGYPTNIVNFEDNTYEDWGEVDPSQMVGTSDQTIRATTKNALGVETKRTIFAWSQNFHDNYIVVDLELTNKSGNTLTDFWVSIDIAPYYWRMANGSTGRPSIPNQDAIDRSACWHHYYGGRPGDSLRVWYMLPADDPETAGDQMGGPIASQDGRFLINKMVWYTILHASETPYTDAGNDVDDPLQPRVTDVYAIAPMGVQPLWGGTDASGRDLIYDLMAGQNAKQQPMEGQYEGTYHRANNDEQGDPDYTNLGIGFSKSSVWNSSYSCFGPYNFENGQTIHIVYAGGYAGISIEKAKELGEQWLAGTLEDAPGLPDPVTGFLPSNFAFPNDATDIDKIKDRWISTGIDTVHKSASKAKWNFEHNWQVPGVPAPPEIEVTGYGDGVEVKWSDPDAEAMDGFDGYRIMRRIGRQDTVFFEQVYRTTADDIAAEHVWKDTELLFGASYFYYVQAGRKIAENDMNAYPTSRGKTVWSGRLWMPTNSEVNPPRFPQDDLSKIRIAPNPYNYRDERMIDYGWTDDRGLIFFNLPAEVTIKIFTESGDLVKTIVHEPLTRAGSLTWDMLTDSQQAIASGVYIAVFEKPSGEVAYQKFLVVR